VSLPLKVSPAIPLVRVEINQSARLPDAMKTIRDWLSASLVLASLFMAGHSEAAAHAPLVLAHVTIIDVTRGRALPDRTVVISGERIADIYESARVTPVKGSQRVDATGKFLIPGLWDAHVHLANLNVPNWGRKVSLPLLVANGITGVRDMGGSFEVIKTLRKEIADGTLPGPHIIAAGPQLGGASPDQAIADMWLASDSADTGRRSVIAQKETGVDFIKIQSFVPRDAYFAIVAEAKNQGLPFVGHVPELISAVEASDAGQRSMEHTMGIWQSCSSAEPEIRKSMTEALKNLKTTPQYVFDRVGFGLPPRGTLATFNDEKASQLFERFVRNGTWQVPTLVEEQSFALLVSNALLDQRGMNYVPLLMLKQWDLPNILVPLSDEDRQDLVKIVPMMLEVVGRMHRAGVRMLAGTDMPWLVVPGFSLHDELILLVTAGLSPAEALRSATLDTAEFLGLQNSLGSIEKGKLADLVLLDQNPLADIRNTQQINAVLLQGHYYDRHALDGLLQKAKADAER
jgi:imidazolonepropionase-like amidohydrolase